MEIMIKSSNIRFRNPNVGQPTRAIEEHYYGRRIIAEIDGVERVFRFTKDEMPFVIDEEEMIDLIEQRLQEEGE